MKKSSPRILLWFYSYRKKIIARLSKHTYTSIIQNFGINRNRVSLRCALFARTTIWKFAWLQRRRENHSTLISRLSRVWAEIFLLIFAHLIVEEMQILRKFLCCMQIETGGFVIGYLYLIGSILFLISSAVLLVQWPDSSEWWSIYFFHQVNCFLAFQVLPLLYMWISTVYIYASYEVIQATKSESCSFPYDLLK